MMQTKEGGNRWMMPIPGRRNSVSALAIVCLGAGLAAGCQNHAAPEETAQADSRPPSVYGLDDVIPASAPRPGAAADEDRRVAAPVEVAGQVEMAPHGPQDPFKAGLEFYADHRMKEAAQALSRAAHEQPGAWYTHYLLGLALWKGGDLEGAVSSLRTSQDLNSRFVKTAINLSRVLNESGDHEGALQAARRAVALDDGSSLAFYLQGRSQANLGRRAAAEASLRKSLSINAAGGHVHNRLGLLLLRQARFQEALPELTEAARLLPAVSYVHNNLGLVYENIGRLEEARRQYQAGLSLSPAGVRLAANLARVESTLGPRRQVAQIPGTGEQRTPQAAATTGN